MCNCIQRVNELLAPDGLALETRAEITRDPNAETMELSQVLAIGTIATRRGAKRKPVRLTFCPFCGVRYASLPAPVLDAVPPHD